MFPIVKKCALHDTVTRMDILAPHIAKKISGQSSMRTVLPLSLFTGAAISLAGDLLTQIFPTPVPAGSTIALIGIPLIFYFITRK